MRHTFHLEHFSQPVHGVTLGHCVEIQRHPGIAFGEVASGLLALVIEHLVEIHNVGTEPGEGMHAVHHGLGHHVAVLGAESPQLHQRRHGHVERAPGLGMHVGGNVPEQPPDFGHIADFKHRVRPGKGIEPRQGRLRPPRVHFHIHPLELVVDGLLRHGVLGHVLDGVRRALGLALVNPKLAAHGWRLGIAARALTSENDKGPCCCKDLCDSWQAELSHRSRRN